jgi:hypothetical protein
MTDALTNLDVHLLAIGGCCTCLRADGETASETAEF